MKQVHDGFLTNSRITNLFLEASKLSEELDALNDLKERSKEVADKEIKLSWIISLLQKENLSNLHLSRLKLKYIDLSTSDFSGTYFYRCSFEGCDLTGCDLTNTRFEECVFYECDTRGIKYSKTRFTSSSKEGYRIQEMNYVA